MTNLVTQEITPNIQLFDSYSASYAGGNWMRQRELLLGLLSSLEISSLAAQAIVERELQILVKAVEADLEAKYPTAAIRKAQKLFAEEKPYESPHHREANLNR